MTRRRNSPLRVLTLMLLPLAISGCFSASLPIVMSAPEIPPLPPSAIQPELPEFCQPTCSAGVARDLERWLLLLTPPERTVSPPPALINP